MRKIATSCLHFQAPRLAQVGLYQRPAAAFRCPFPWIPPPLGAIGDAIGGVGIREDGGPTATEGGEENRAGMWERAGPPNRWLLLFLCWITLICLRLCSWMFASASSSSNDNDSTPTPYNGACRAISSWSDVSSVRMYC